jgi:RNA recognition motif-containing protein
MFIGGLSWQTTTEGLKDYFAKFGEIGEAMVMKDPTTRRSRGFGFVTYSDTTGVDRVLSHGTHTLDGKKIDPKVAFPRRSNPKMVTKTKKVSVGGHSAPTTVEDVRNYFQQFGKIEDVMLMFDKQTNRHRGFGFLIYENEEVVDKVCEIHFHEINNKMVECKKAQPKEVMLPANLAKSRAAGARGLGELLMVSPHTGSGMLQTLRYSPYSVPVSTNTAMVAALAQQPLVAAAQTANQAAAVQSSPQNVSPPPSHHYHQFDLNSIAAAAAMNNAAAGSFPIPFADYYAAAVATTSASAAGQQQHIFPAISSLHQLTPHTTADSGASAVTACRPTSEPFVPNLAELMFPKNSVLYA